ncbi:S41 family peptidase [Pseudoflavitalea rhizosphaerae]|uniref:S41 family peptidase n=1 Tax=Pseudoflavitalea rhizosphaerae TaxID=1884793 RepID=UPI000F8D7CD9|nr:S41 family peptidase [Pseudoflavitalea rhizosphaerae]
MRKFLALIFGCLILSVAKAQVVNGCSASLDSLHDFLKQTPSFRQQISGNEKVKYYDMLAALRTEAANVTNPFDCFLLQTKLVLPLKDNHLFLYQLPVREFRYAQLQDSVFLQQLLEMPAYKDFPRVNVSRDSLEEVLAARPADSVEGIYWYEKLMKVGVFRTAKADSLLAVVLFSKMPHWEAGQLAFILSEFRPAMFRAIHANLLTKNFMLYRNEKMIDGRLVKVPWKKDPAKKDHINLPANEPLFSLKWLTNGVQYLRLGSFATNTKTLKASDDFYDHIRDSLTAKILVVDLRNNGGGGFRNSMKYVKLLNKFSRRAKIYLLINNGTYSNAEAVAITLKRAGSVTTVGMDTHGTLTYGNNYGNTKYLYGSGTALYPTDMKDEGHFLPYEDAGLQPDIKLKADQNWMEQVLEIIGGQ